MENLVESCSVFDEKTITIGKENEIFPSIPVEKLDINDWNDFTNVSRNKTRLISRTTGEGKKTLKYRNEKLEREKSDRKRRKKFCCYVCNFKGSKRDLKRHMVIHSYKYSLMGPQIEEQLKKYLAGNELQILNCSLCNYSTKHKKNLRRHVLKHRHETEHTCYKCSQCSYTCQLECDLQIHSLVHEDTTSECPACSLSCKDEKQLKSHMLTAHKKSKFLSEVEYFKCTQCDYVSNLQGDLSKHILTHTKFSRKKLSCELCTYTTNHAGHLSDHMLTHSNTNTKTFKCCECDCTFSRKHHLKKHALLTHEKKKHVQEKLRCELCAYATNHKGHLIRHMLTHSNEKRFKCSQCDYASYRKVKLNRHILTHKFVSYEKCRDCPYTTSSKGRFNEHLLIHSDTRKFKCPQCDYSCNRTYHLKRHTLLIHSKS